MSTIEIRPIEVKKWHGKQGEQSFASSKKYRALINADTKRYAIDLSEKDVKRLQHLSEDGDLDTVHKGSAHPFWDANKMAVLDLPNSTKILNLDKDWEYLQYKIAKGSKFIADSLQELEEGNFPEATHVMYDEQEEVEVKASKIKAKQTCIIKAQKLSVAKKVSLIMLLDGLNFKGKSSDTIDVKIDALISRDAVKFLELVNKDPKEINLRAMVLEALQKSILINKNGKITYNESTLGLDVEDVVENLSEVENQEVKMRLAEELDVK